MPTICELLVQEIPAILAEWERLIDRPPWNTLSDAKRHGGLIDILRALIDEAACATASAAARRRVVFEAAAHADARRASGFDADTVLQEHAMLRDAIWTVVRVSALQSPAMFAAATDMIVRLDAAITLSTIAALKGFHRREIEAQHGWDGALHDLVRRWDQLATPRRGAPPMAVPRSP